MMIKKNINASRLMTELRVAGLPIASLNIEPYEDYDVNTGKYKGLKVSVQPVYSVQPTEGQQDAAAQIINDHNYGKDYRDRRRGEYPTTGEQLDAIYRLFYDMAVEFPAFKNFLRGTDFVKTLKAVKDKYPKESE